MNLKLAINVISLACLAMAGVKGEQGEVRPTVRLRLRLRSRHGLRARSEGESFVPFSRSIRPVA
jgi:hypothetical protein